MITIRSGKFKNKKLAIPENGVRPTSDKIRQAIFNILAHNNFGFSLNGARVLDAFAGTGALGIEALSRGAAHVWLMENNPAVKKVLTQNIVIGLDAATLIFTDACSPPRAPETMDLVFLDPPYEQNLLSPAITALTATGWVAPETLLVMETRKDEAWEKPNGLEILDTRRYGNTEISFATFSRK